MRFLQIALLFSLLATTYLMYMTTNNPTKQCTFLMYNLSGMKVSTKNGTTDGVLGEARMFCEDVNREQGL